MTNKKLAQNTYKQSILKILNELCRKKTPITLWKLYLDRKWSLTLSITVVRSAQSEIMIHIEEGKEKSLKEIMSGEKYLRFHVEDRNILFQCRLKYFNAPDLVLEIPQFIAIEDMRKNLRLKNENEDNRLLIHKALEGNIAQSKKFDKKIQDISAGGLSFVINSQEESYFHQSKKFYEAIITLGGKDIFVKLTLITLIAIEPNSSNGLLYKSYKACFKFDSLSPEDKQYIENYVLQNYKLTA